VDHRDLYLREILALEAPPTASQCFSCQSVPGIYRCTDCIGDRLSCLECCCKLHHLAPYHRIKKWNGTYFEGSDLVYLGLVIQLGHGGQSCPWYDAPQGVPSSSGMSPQDIDIEDDWEDETVIADTQEEAIPLDRPSGMSGTRPESQSWGPAAPGTHRMVVVTSNGIFRRQVRWCQCHGRAEEHIQLLHLNLFPASIRRPSTAFTFDVLDHLHIDAMECKTAALNFYNKLRRLTNNAFPATAPVSVHLQ
jgi:hypothetical protein